MLTFPNAKINLGLNITGKRTDGYHNIETCFIPIPLTDILEIVEAKQVQFDSTGIEIPGNEDSNLCLKAYHLLQKDFQLPPVHIHLHKIIPIGAGLGGGSSDASFTLKSLNEQLNLYLNDDLLEEYAAKLGSDCPFFIQNKPVLAYERGNVFEPVEVTLKGKYLALIYPALNISTAEAYAGIQPRQPDISIKEILEKIPYKDWEKCLLNDFETSIFVKFPTIGHIKEKLYALGATYASMSGSGSSVFGIFDSEPDLEPHFPDLFGKLFAL